MVICLKIRFVGGTRCSLAFSDLQWKDRVLGLASSSENNACRWAISNELCSTYLTSRQTMTLPNNVLPVCFTWPHFRNLSFAHISEGLDSVPTGCSEWYLQNFEVVQPLEGMAWDVSQLIPWDASVTQNKQTSKLLVNHEIKAVLQTSPWTYQKIFFFYWSSSDKTSFRFLLHLLVPGVVSCFSTNFYNHSLNCRRIKK